MNDMYEMNTKFWCFDAIPITRDEEIYSGKFMIDFYIYILKKKKREIYVIHIQLVLHKP